MYFFKQMLFRTLSLTILSNKHIVISFTYIIFFLFFYVFNLFLLDQHLSILFFLFFFLLSSLSRSDHAHSRFNFIFLILAIFLIIFYFWGMTIVHITLFNSLNFVWNLYSNLYIYI